METRRVWRSMHSPMLLKHHSKKKKKKWRRLTILADRQAVMLKSLYGKFLSGKTLSNFDRLKCNP